MDGCLIWQVGESSEAARPAVDEAIARALPPEFVNRLDQVVLSNRLPNMAALS